MLIYAHEISFSSTYVEHTACSLDVEALKERADEMTDKQKLFLSLHNWFQLVFHEPTTHKDHTPDEPVLAVTQRSISICSRPVYSLGTDQQLPHLLKHHTITSSSDELCE